MVNIPPQENPNPRMPDFFVVGAQKAGTTTLYFHLKSHPEIFMSPVKEPHFFSYGDGEEPRREPGWGGAGKVTEFGAYRELFRDVADEKAVGEASTSYLYVPRSAERIKRRVPEARVIVVLRHPAERAFSGFLHGRQRGLEPLKDFSRALEAEESRVEAGWGPLYHYRRRSLYHDQLERYFEAFGRDRVGVYLYEDLKEKPAAVVRDVFGFLGVDSAHEPDVSARHNVSGVPRSGLLRALTRPGFPARVFKRYLPETVRGRLKKVVYAKPKLSPAAREALNAGYREEISRLEGLLDRDLSRWSR